MSNRYPGYDVLRKRDSPSWNDQTRAVIDARLAIDPHKHIFFTAAEWPTLRAICDRIVPQPPDRAQPVPIAAMIDQMLDSGARDGYRDARLPPNPEAWRRGLSAIDAEARSGYGHAFQDIETSAQDGLLAMIQKGVAQHPLWGDMPPKLFFAKRLLHDIVAAYYGHPTAWSEIGFGGPASPRGYVRLNPDRRDPWEASEAQPGREDAARRDNARVG
jgi:hypothetical protein